jgi:hypothetical protein
MTRYCDFPLHKAARVPHLSAMTSDRHSAPPLSHMLTDAAQQSSGDYITIAQLVAGLKTQALALLLILFALPNILPSPPGTTAIFGAPLVLLTLQMALGRDLWLPRVVLDRAMPRAGLLSLLAKAQPYFARVERLLRPRLLVLTSPSAQRALGAVMVLLSVMIMLPIPLANTGPSIAITLMAIGMVERDGAFILAGIAAAIGATLLVVTIYWALIALALAQVTAWLAP